MTELKKNKTRALVIRPEFSEVNARKRVSKERVLEEACGLARAIDLQVQDMFFISGQKPRPATLLGKGKVEELKAHVRDHLIELVVVDADLSPVQQRNLERALNAKVLDRTGLILEIFGRRARTKEGRLQVELAHLTYQRSRLVRSWTHLERQRGGVGFLGGPGETQIEADRRILSNKITKLKKELAGVKRTRQLHRTARKKVPYPIAALVGYTNAGKSTLFNRLTSADVLADDMLFATLDPTMRLVELPSGAHIILSDTVGFISNLPTELIAAFRATLEEVTEADVILHVRDMSDPERDSHKKAVESILKDLLGSAPETPIIELQNKIDLLDAELDGAHLAPQHLDPSHIAHGVEPELIHPISARTGEGVDAFLAFLDSLLSATHRVFDIILAPEEGEALAWLYTNSEVVERSDAPSGTIRLSICLAPADYGRYEKRFGSFILADQSERAAE